MNSKELSKIAYHTLIGSVVSGVCSFLEKEKKITIDPNEVIEFFLKGENLTPITFPDYMKWFNVVQPDQGQFVTTQQKTQKKPKIPAEDSERCIYVFQRGNKKRCPNKKESGEDYCKSCLRKKCVQDDMAKKRGTSHTTSSGIPSLVPLLEPKKQEPPKILDRVEEVAQKEKEITIVPIGKSVTGVDRFFMEETNYVLESLENDSYKVVGICLDEKLKNDKNMKLRPLTNSEKDKAMGMGFLLDK